MAITEKGPGQVSSAITKTSYLKDQQMTRKKNATITRTTTANQTLKAVNRPQAKQNPASPVPASGSGKSNLPVKESMIPSLLETPPLLSDPALTESQDQNASMWIQRTTEVPIPVQWLEYPNLLGANKISIRGQVASKPFTTRVKGNTLSLGKVLVKIWNPLAVPTEEKFSTQNVAVLSVVGFEDLAEVIAALNADDIILVNGVLTTRKYDRKFEGEHETFTATMYDVSLVARSIVKYVQEVEDYQLPEIPFETQVQDD
jgi:hypothetical protein